MYDVVQRVTYHTFDNTSDGVCLRYNIYCYTPVEHAMQCDILLLSSNYQ